MINELFITGAGVSADSGIPTFRGNDGFWTIGSINYTPQEMATRKKFEENPDEFLLWYYKRFAKYKNVQPNSTHKWLADKYLITQNIDGMHQRAYSKNVLELHGSLWRLRCDEDNYTINDLENYKYVKRMCKCGSWLRPDIVWFEDSLDHKIMNRAAAIISDCDLFVSIGTSGLVWPAAGYINLAKNSGALCVDINPEEGNFNSVFDVKIRDIASKGLDKLLKILRPILG